MAGHLKEILVGILEQVESEKLPSIVELHRRFRLVISVFEANLSSLQSVANRIYTTIAQETILELLQRNDIPDEVINSTMASFVDASGSIHEMFETSSERMEATPNGENYTSQKQEIAKRYDESIYREALSSLGTPEQFLFILKDNMDFDSFLQKFNSILLKDRNHSPHVSSDSPHHIIRIGYDGDMLDDLFRVATLGESTSVELMKMNYSLVSSKQAIFQHLYELVTKEKFLIIHITENPLAYFFDSTVMDNINPITERGALRYDEKIKRFVRSLQIDGAEEHRAKFTIFYKIATSVLMELSNVFLVAPTVGMHNHLVITNWRTYALLLGFSPLTWTSGNFRIYDSDGQEFESPRYQREFVVLSEKATESKLSMPLFWAQAFNDFIDDVDHALHIGIPREILMPIARHTLLNMITRCLVELHTPTQAINSILVGLIYMVPQALRELQRLLEKGGVLGILFARLIGIIDDR